MEYMNAMARDKSFHYEEVSAIANAIDAEYWDRKARDLVINGKTERGRQEINKRVSEITNRKLGKEVITAADVRLYKRCIAEEYTDRTGKCAWGFKEVRRRYGFDEKTGLELALG